jgi:hypothetical protein
VILFGPRFSPPQIWAVDDTAVQITWGRLPAGPVTARCEHRSVTIDHDGGPGSIELDGLAPNRLVTVTLEWGHDQIELTASTLPTPPGPRLHRFATISDLHLGATDWGALRTMRDRSGHPIPHPFRCAEAAIAEAVAWGAELLIIKGDSTEHEHPDHFAQLADLVDRFPDLPMLLLPGNHDVEAASPCRPERVGRRGLPFITSVDHVDLAGIRIVGADTTIRRRGWGTLAGVQDLLLHRVATSDRPVFIALHQQLQPTVLPRSWPIGIPAPASNRFLDRVDRLSAPVVVSSGHTHRNRSRRHGSVLITEVASTKDWPGVWAGYTVHEGGISQVVRRVAAPTAISWTEYSRGALFGLWAPWAAGPMDQRCLTASWPSEHQGDAGSRVAGNLRSGARID